jgi:pimeloyl-ACP methyl ester carboxylesterase
VWRLAHDVLGLDRFSVVGHDWGGPVAYALAATHPDEVERLAIIDVPPPHDGAPWGPSWHHLFHNVEGLAEALVGGREDVYLGWFYANIGHPSYTMPESAVAEYLRTYSDPAKLHAGFEYYRAIRQDTADNTELARRCTLPMPVLAIQAGGPFSLEPDTPVTSNPTADGLRGIVADLYGEIVDGTGHWIPEERPAELAELLARFFADPASCARA